MKCKYPNCDFGVHNETEYCVFHCPKDKKGISVEQFCSDLRHHTSEGLSNFKGFVFMGPIDLSNIEFRYPTLFNDVEFPESVDFSRANFENSVDFTGVTFGGGADFRGTKFGGKAKFSKTKFVGPLKKSELVNECANFTGSQFFASVDFKMAKFENGAAIFSNANFRGPDIEFCSAVFKDGPAVFSGSKFDGTIDFNGINFVDHNAIFANASFRNGSVLFMKAYFGGTADFNNIVINNGIKLLFVSSKFEGNLRLGGARISCSSILFEDVSFSNDQTTFNGCTFEAEAVSFIQVIFDSKNTDFQNTVFSKGYIRFLSCQFSKGPAEFQNAIFNGRSINFDGTKFSGGNAYFTGSRFNDGDVSFTETDFIGGDTSFRGVVFDKNVIFEKNKIAGILDFSDTKIGDDAKFYFRFPIFINSEESTPLILFERVHFYPFVTFFENIKPGNSFSSNDIINKPIIKFRYCNLKDVYFANNDMSIISFFNSSFFEEARFVSCKWITRKEKIVSFCKFIKFLRHTQIIEEQLLSVLLDPRIPTEERYKIRKNLNLQYLNSHRDVATMYMWLKTAADNAKDYRLAAWFYFNEFEMKRLNFLHYNPKGKSCNKMPHLKYSSPRYLLYTIYKVFAGYGEKPFWSFLWFLIFVILFASLHMLNGIKIPNTVDLIKYKPLFSSEGVIALFSGKFWHDLFYAITFSLSRIIPTNYLPGFRMDIECGGIWPINFLLSFFNSFVLIFLLIMVGIGLKRHFRRF